MVMSRVSQHMKRLMSVFETSCTSDQKPEGKDSEIEKRQKTRTANTYEQGQTRPGANHDDAAAVRSRRSDAFLNRLATFEPRSAPEPILGSAQPRQARVNNSVDPIEVLSQSRLPSAIPGSSASACAQREGASRESESSGEGQSVSSSSSPRVQSGLLRPTLATDAAAEQDRADAPARSGHSGAGEPGERFEPSGYGGAEEQERARAQPSSCGHFSLLHVKILPSDEGVYDRTAYDDSLADGSREARHQRFRCCAKLLEERLNPQPTVRQPPQTRQTEGLTLLRERELSDNLLRDGMPADASWFEREESGEVRFAICRAILRLRISEDESAASEPRQQRATICLGAIPIRMSAGPMSHGLPSAATIEKSDGGDVDDFAVPWFDSTLADGSREARKERFRLCADLLDSRLREYLSSVQI